MKINLAVVFGGQSVEHDISVITAMQVMKNCNTEKYNVLPIYITKDGEWLSDDELKNIEAFHDTKNFEKLAKVAVLPHSNFLHKKTMFGYKKWKSIDVGLFCLHGTNGEDGSLPAMFQLSGIPYTAPSMFASSLACDKVNFKYATKGLGLNVTEFLAVFAYEYESNKAKTLKQVVDQIGFPCIVKPARLGSSIGINVCKNNRDLERALSLGFSLGEQVIVEQYLEEIREINCAVAGVFDEILVSELEEPIKINDILSFENKYVSEQGAGDMAQLKRRMPPKISKKSYNEIAEISEMLFKKLGMKGIVRIDYMLSKDNVVYVNEINTIPGSLSYYLFKPKNVTFEGLIDNLVRWAIFESATLQQKIKNFESDILKNADLSGGIKK